MNSLSSPKILGNQKLSCYIRTIVTSECSAMSSAHFLSNDGSFSIVHSPTPATSDMSLKTVQVASILDVC